MIKGQFLASVKSFQNDLIKMGVAGSNTSVLEQMGLEAENRQHVYDFLVTDPDLRKSTRGLFLDGHFSRAIEEAYKCINNTVKKKSGMSIDGQDLMNHVFSLKNPTLKINEMKTESQKNEQIGYMLCLSGCMVGIRNPRAHEHDLVDSAEDALELLVWANHLMRRIYGAKRVRKRGNTIT